MGIVYRCYNINNKAFYIYKTKIKRYANNLAGLLAEYMNLPQPVKYGISGVCGLFAVRLYMILDAILKSAQNDPLSFISSIKNKEPQ